MNRLVGEYNNAYYRSIVNADYSALTTAALNTKIRGVENKIPNTIDLVTTTILNTKIGEAEDKIPNSSGLVPTTILNKKNEEVENKLSDHDKCITTPEFKKIASNILNMKLKQANQATNCVVNTKSQRANKNKEKI